jgi:hypothetical protein
MRDVAQDEYVISFSELIKKLPMRDFLIQIIFLRKG